MSRQRPAIHTGASQMLTSTSWNGRNSHRDSLVPELPAAIAVDNSSCGHPCPACQIRYGDHTTTAASTPAGTHAVRSAERGPAVSTPMNTALR